MSEFRDQVITCPHCGKEYLAAEIIYPGAIMGRPTNIIRDALGKILYVEWQEDWEPATTDKYCCDKCDKPFVVEAAVSYKVKKETEELDFTNQYSSLLDT